MHAEAPTAVGLLDVDGVVEIARIVGINCDDKFFAQIFAFRELPSVDFFRNALRLIQNIVGKFCRQMIFADDREHVDAWRRRRPEHFDDFSFGANMARFPGVQTNNNLIANRRGGLRLTSRYRPHVNVVHKPRIIGYDVVKIT